MPSATLISSAASSHLPPLPVFLALGVRRACVYTPAFQGINLWVVCPLGMRKKLATRDVVGMLGHLGCNVTVYGRNGHFCTAQYGIWPYHVQPLKDTPRPWTVRDGTRTVRP